MGNYLVTPANCLEGLTKLPDASVDAVVTDPPYGLENGGGGGFMGEDWDGTNGFWRSLNPNDAGRDNAFGRLSSRGPEYRAGRLYQEFCEAWAKECLRILKPGGYLLSFGGARTYHRLTCGIEDAGFEIRDQIMWLYGSGFPKSMDISKALDKAAGAEREVIGEKRFADGSKARKTQMLGDNAVFSDPVSRASNLVVTAPAPDAARQWSGWGTALKPAHEPIAVARKALIGTVIENVLAYGTGGINIDACRVEHVTVGNGSLALNPHLRTHINGGNGGNIIAHEEERRVVTPNQDGRFPANVIHDGSEEVTSTFPAESSVTGKRSGRSREADVEGTNWLLNNHKSKEYTDSGSPARFFYCAKASKSERHLGLAEGQVNHHPTVKPLALMRYLVRLVTPPGGVVLDPFTGSGTTGMAALLEGFGFIGFENKLDYLPIALSRVAWAARENSQSAIEDESPASGIS